jgi:hypothetical protein
VLVRGEYANNLKANPKGAQDRARHRKMAELYAVYTMKKASGRGSTVLTIRVPRSLDHRLAREARKRRRTRSETARALLESALAGAPDEDPAEEARRQSRLASRQSSEKEPLAFIADAADLRGWE